MDEFQMIVSPVVVGGGKRFFPDGVRLDLTLVEQRRFGNGVVVLRYEYGLQNQVRFLQSTEGRGFRNIVGQESRIRDLFCCSASGATFLADRVRRLATAEQGGATFSSQARRRCGPLPTVPWALAREEKMVRIDWKDDSRSRQARRAHRNSA